MNIKVLATIVGALSLNTLAAGCVRSDHAVKHTPVQGSQDTGSAKGGEDACGHNSCGAKSVAREKGSHATCGESTCAAHSK